MSDGLGLLNDKTSYESNFLTNIDPRIKLLFSVMYLFLIISTNNIIIPLAIILVMVIGLISLKINKKVFILRGLPAIFIAITVLITQIFLYGKTPIFTINLLGLKIYGFQEGFDRGILLMLRVLAGISTMLFLSMSTSISKLIFAAKYFHIPNAVLEVLTITYRYIFVLFEEMFRVKNAQKIRLGFSSYKKTLKTFGNMGGIIIIRTIDKSEKLYRSMNSRGYNGQQIKVQYNTKFGKSDFIITILLTIIFIIMLYFSL